jgi:hypothetical protein
MGLYTALGLFGSSRKRPLIRINTIIYDLGSDPPPAIHACSRSGPDKNHAKIGASTSGTNHYSIFGDMNQQGTATDPKKCGSSQNGRGGLFYVIDDADLANSVTDLIKGDTAPTASTRGGRSRRNVFAHGLGGI